ncbi:lysoplasmalogenase-like protein TMEM86A [Puma concolor]|uniref:lysoplasmalogenase n=1 Tax=Puma concolor TaxID=9696 RepID=A0A6P6I8R9_PUMCO|nr:lysoplasmalogenase-like protein TMEM86A [Puma concolor]
MEKHSHCQNFSSAQQAGSQRGGVSSAPPPDSRPLIGRGCYDVVGIADRNPSARPGERESGLEDASAAKATLAEVPQSLWEVRKDDELVSSSGLGTGLRQARPPGAVEGVKSEGPKLVPFFKATCVYFVLWLPSSSPSWVSALIKCLPIFCLWLFLLAHGLGFLLTHPSATRIFVGLVFSALGDAFLIWQDQGYFVHGLLMFAVTHMLYASAFGMRPLALRTGLVMAVLSGLCYALLYPGLSGAFTYLVGVYVALISFMGWRAMAGLRLVGAAWRWTELAAGSGALLFIISDLTIALNKFCFPVPYSRALIMSTYYAAQMLIALSAVESREPVEDYRLSKAN